MDDSKLTTPLRAVITDAQTHAIRKEIRITGIVQGVGFRPYVYRYAIELPLSGTVLNNALGVTITLQGLASDIQHFIDKLKACPPPLARIDSIVEKPLPLVANEHGFSIIHSQGGSDAVVAVSADKCVCEDCLAECRDPSNRHYRYPFTNCTNCGPRYTIIRALPYDRPNTAMAEFEMCDACAAAYRDPLNRRYHAQPVSCPKCGPQLRYLSTNGETVCREMTALDMCIGALKQGKVIAIKGLGGFHLVADATNDDAVALLRMRKHRPAKPFAVMVSDLAMAQSYATGSAFEWQLLQSAERPITLLQKTSSAQSATLSPLVAPNIDKIGLFLPYTPLHYLLLDSLKLPIIATSANLSGEPIITDASDIVEQLGHVIDGVLDHNRPIINGCDDSVVQAIDDKIQVLRLARGYAPLSLHIAQPITQSILAVGAQQKSTIAFGFKHNLFLSPHIGDIESVGASGYFERTLQTFSRLYNFDADMLIHDKHPTYTSSKWALAQAVQRLSIQHHFAHVLSVMAVNQVTEKVLGFSFDGTGLGEHESEPLAQGQSSHLWGGEVFIADVHGYQRICHLQPFALIGGEQAIKTPVRILLSLLFPRYEPSQLHSLKISAINQLSETELNNLYRIWQSGRGCISTSSVGRLFDAVAVALGLIETTQFEGQAGMLLEAAANRVATNAPLFYFNLPHRYAPKQASVPLNDSKSNHNEQQYQWDTQTLMLQIINAIVEAPLTESRIELIAHGFMSALTRAIVSVSQHFTNYPIVFSGGVFQNRFLLEQCLQQCHEQQRQVLSPGLVPLNDGGIALGQLWFGIHNQHLADPKA